MYLDEASSGQLSKIKVLATPSRQQLHAKDARGRNPLFVWVRSCLDARVPCQDVVAGCVFLSYLGFSLHETDSDGQTLLHALNECDAQYIDLVKFLIKSRVNPFAKDKQGRVPLCHILYDRLGLSERLVDRALLEAIRRDWHREVEARVASTETHIDPVKVEATTAHEAQRIP